MRGQAYVEYLVVLGVIVAALALSSGNDSPLAHLADTLRNLYLTQVAATAAPPLPLSCGDGTSSPAMMLVNCK